MQTIIFFFLIFLLSSIPLPSSSIKIHHNRRILHQPFFPFDSHPPTSQPPLSSPQPQPKYPFSSVSPPNKGNPFFPFYSSPPPPPHPSTTLATFPANISSLILPDTSSSKPISRKLVAVAVSLSLLSAALITGVAAFLLYHRRNRSFTDSKASRTDSLRLFPPNTTTSDGSHKPLRNVSSTSSEFLYLGTLRGVDEDDHKAANSSNAGASSMPAYQKLGSPELHPLPPLPRQNFRQNHRNAEAGSCGEDEGDEEEEFFSPRGSSGGKGSPTGPGSSSRTVFMGVEAENFGSRNSNSRTASYPSSNSASPTPSVPSSPFMPLNLSPRSLRSKSPDSLVDFPARSRPPPAMPPQTMVQSPPKRQIQQSPARRESVSGQHAPVKLPPPPPPPPPPRFWEIPVALRALNQDPITGPPVLVKPSRPVVLQTPEPVSPVEQAQNLETMERNEETPKPKLKPLHWDKVRASSDRAMVWDQLKSSSFQ